MQVAASRMGDLCREGGLEGALRALMLDGAGTPRRLKTFTVEVSGPGDLASSHEDVAWRTRPAGQDGVSILTCVDAREGLPDCEIILDRRPGRFCLAHVAEEDAVAKKMIAVLAYTTRLSRAWVCPSVLEELAGGRGGNGRGLAGTVRMASEAGGGRAEADVGHDGTVAHAGGESVGAHLRIAGDVLAASAKMCANAERFRIGAVDTPRGTRFDMKPIDIQLSRRIDDVPAFVSRVLDGGPPLFMDGNAAHAEHDQYSVAVADLECAQYMGMDMTPGLIHVGIRLGYSGSGVLRLLSWLQLHHDPMLRCEQVMAGACGA